MHTHTHTTHAHTHAHTEEILHCRCSVESKKGRTTSAPFFSTRWKQLVLLCSNQRSMTLWPAWHDHGNFESMRITSMLIYELAGQSVTRMLHQYLSGLTVASQVDAFCTAWKYCRSFCRMGRERNTLTFCWLGSDTFQKSLDRKGHLTRSFTWSHWWPANNLLVVSSCMWS